jgi:anti-anti-sigma factor
MTLPISIERERGGVARVRAHGEIDLDNAYLVRDAVTAALAASKPKRLVVDLGAVPFMDSVGIGILVSCFYTAAACRVPMTVENPRPTVFRQLWVSGVAGLFGLSTAPSGEDDRAAATSSASMRTRPSS